MREAPPAPEPSVVHVSDLLWASEQNGLGPAERDRSNGEGGAADGAPITLNGVTYAKGVGAHAHSEIRIELAGLYAMLANGGLDWFITPEASSR